MLNLYVTASVLEVRSEAAVRSAGFPSLAAFNVLTVLHGAGQALRRSVIAERVFVTCGTMTGVLRSLHRRNLVRLTPHPEDGRMPPVEMTPGASGRVLDYLGRVHAAERHLMANLSPARQRQLLDALVQLQTGIERLEL